MTTAELLPRVRRRLGLTDSARDVLISDLIDDARGFALAYTGLSEMPAGLEHALCELAVAAYGRMGVEGQQSHAEGGVSVSFDSLPKHIRAALNAYRAGKVG